MGHKIREFFADELYEKNCEAARASNLAVLKATLIAGMVCMAVLAIVSSIVERHFGTWFTHALAAMAFFGIMYALTVLLKGKMGNMAGYVLYLAFVVFCFYTSAFLWPDDICIMMPAGLFVFSAFYLDKSWRVILTTLLLSVLYIGGIRMYKVPFCVGNEAVSVICFSVIGCVAGTAVRQMKLKNIDHERENREQAERDGMTGVYNHNTAEKMITQRLAESALKNAALLLIDIDGLKKINDTFGHPQGDRAICEVAETLKNTFAAPDIIGRIGGDEFMAFLGNPGGRHKIEAAAEQFMEKLRDAGAGADGERPVTVSIGIAAIGTDAKGASAAGGCSFAELYRRADVALYRAKNEGRNRYAFSSPGENAEDRVEDRGK